MFDDGAVDDTDEVIIVHDCAPGWKAKDTQALLVRTFGVNNFIPGLDNNDSDIPRWPGNSADMNVVENFGSILMDQVELKILGMNEQDQYANKQVLIQLIEESIEKLADDAQMLSNLIYSFVKRCKECVARNGGPLNY